MSARKQLPCWNIENMRRRVSRARKGFFVTCPSSRHLHMLADALSTKRRGRIVDKPEHVAQSIYAVLESLWKARARIIDLENKLEEARQ